MCTHHACVQGSPPRTAPDDTPDAPPDGAEMQPNKAATASSNGPVGLGVGGEAGELGQDVHVAPVLEDDGAEDPGRHGRVHQRGLRAQQEGACAAQAAAPLASSR